MSQQINLKTLNLCGNPLNGFPSITSSRTLETLCLEGKAAVLPHQAATKFPQLADVTLAAPSLSVRAELDSTTQSELSNLRKLITLSIGKIILHFTGKVISSYCQLTFAPDGLNLYHSSQSSQTSHLKSMPSFSLLIWYVLVFLSNPLSSQWSYIFVIISYTLKGILCHP
jgi:hypothetical protein